ASRATSTSGRTADLVLRFMTCLLLDRIASKSIRLSNGTERTFGTSTAAELRSPPLGRRASRRPAGEPGEELPRYLALLGEAGIPVRGGEEIPVCTDGGGGLARLVLRDGTVEPDLVISGGERQGPLEIWQCGTGPIALHLQRAEAVERVGVARSEIRRALVGTLRLVEPAEGAQCVAQVVLRLGVARIELGGGLELAARLLELAFSHRDDAQRIVGLGPAGVEPQGA